MKKMSLYILISLIIGTTIAVRYSAHKVTPGKSFDTIIVGTNTEFPPFSFREEETITGFDIDVITEVAKRLDKKILFKDMPFNALLPEIQLDNIQVIAAGMIPTKERRQQALFTEPYLTGDNLVIISRKDNPITSMTDLIGKTTIVNEGYIAESYMTNQQGITVISIASNVASDGILALQNNKADAFISTLFPLKPYFNNNEINDFIITPIPNTQQSSAFGISKHYPELRDYIQIMLDHMQEDGTLDELKKKWNLS